MKLEIHSNIHDYDVLFEENEEFIADLSTLPQSCFVVDDNIWRIYSSTLLRQIPEEQVIVIPIHENKKNLDTVRSLYDRLVEFPAKRNLSMISIGGGILQDISGFAASTLYRGIKWIFMPTTLLAQADSCIGSKTSLNYQNYKNLVGTFYPPNRIHIYPAFLKTLLDVDYYSGLGEIIKLHIMGGKETYHSLAEKNSLLQGRDANTLTTAIKQALEIKLSYMADDEFDLGRRNLLNYGHDFGHAVESVTNFDIPHGQAVIFGMIAANIVARRRGILSASVETDMAEKVLYPNLLTRLPPGAFDSVIMVNAMKKDKKRVGVNLALIYLDDSFSFSRTNDLTEEEVASTLEEIKSRLGYSI